VEEGPAGPERRRGGRELALLVREPLHVEALDEVGVLLQRLLQRHEHDAGARVHLGVDHARAALHQQP
jgi:hypothetical protein